MKERLTDERLLELQRIRHFVVPFSGVEKAFTFEELQALVDEIQSVRAAARMFEELRQKMAAHSGRQ